MENGDDWGVQNIMKRERERMKTTFWLFGNNGRAAIHSFGLFCTTEPNRIAMGRSSGSIRRVHQKGCATNGVRCVAGRDTEKEKQRCQEKEERKRKERQTEEK